MCHGAPAEIRQGAALPTSILELRTMSVHTMKTRHTSAAALLLVALVAASCGPRTIALTASPDVPAASGVAKIASTDNGNTRIELSVKHLAMPSRISSNATVYLVWVRGNEPGARPQSLGALRVDNDLNGSISGVTALRQFELYVTAEPEQTAAMPTGRPLLFTSISMK